MQRRLLLFVHTALMALWGPPNAVDGWRSRPRYENALRSDVSRMFGSANLYSMAEPRWSPRSFLGPQPMPASTVWSPRPKLSFSSSQRLPSSNLPRLFPKKVSPPFFNNDYMYSHPADQQAFSGYGMEKPFNSRFHNSALKTDYFDVPTPTADALFVSSPYTRPQQQSSQEAEVYTSSDYTENEIGQEVGNNVDSHLKLAAPPKWLIRTEMTSLAPSTLAEGGQNPNGSFSTDAIPEHQGDWEQPQSDQLKTHRRGIRAVNSPASKSNCHSHNLSKCGHTVIDNFKMDTNKDYKCNIRKNFLDCMVRQRERDCASAEDLPLSPEDTNSIRSQVEKLLWSARGCLLIYENT